MRWLPGARRSGRTGWGVRALADRDDATGVPIPIKRFPLTRTLATLFPPDRPTGSRCGGQCVSGGSIMKRFLFAAALVALVASVGTAEERPTVITTTPAAPVVVTTAGTPVAEYAPAQTQRRGLFGRIRNRNH